MKLSGLLVALGALCLLSATDASAAGFETVKHFAPLNIPQPPPKNASEFPEDTQLGGVSGMAVNRTGAGGVEPGTLYTAGYDAGEWHVARFSPEGEFEVGWRGAKRCGPLTGEPPSPPCPPVSTAPAPGIDVDINQATGDVYVFSESISQKVLRIYEADGTFTGTEFGEPDFSGLIAATPAKFHRASGPQGMAVNDEGVVYLYDVDGEFVHRLMIFKPKTPGDFSEYEYAGEILNGPSATNGPRKPVFDDAGHIYTEAKEEFVEEYSPSGAKLCEFNFKKGGITSIAVNPVSEEPFFYTSKDHLVHHLGACAGGKFEEEAGVPPFQPEPQRSEVMAMTVNPELEWSEEPSPGVIVEHPAGTLYAGAPESCPGVSSCPAEAQGQSALGYILAQAVENPPQVEAQSVLGVGTSSATLQATLNPKGSQTTYAFQYLSRAAYEEAGESFEAASEAPLGGGDAGAANKAVSVQVSVSGLAPGTAYAYRVIAQSHCAPAEAAKVCEDTGSPGFFSTFSPESGALPDHRAWELVSPANKNGGEAIPAEPGAASCGGNCKPGAAAGRFPALVSSDGDAVAYQGSPFSLNTGASEYEEYVSRRSSSGWQTTSLSPPMMGDAGGAGFKAFDLSATLGEAVVHVTNPALTPQVRPGFANLMREAVGDPLALEPFVLAPAPEHRETSGSNSWAIGYAGASADFSRFFFEANDALTEAISFAPAAEDGGETKTNLYEWSAGQLRLVNVQPGNAETIPGASFGSGRALDKMTNPVEDLAGAISADGSRVFWSSESGQLYVREDAEVSFPVPGAGPTARFLAASPDGARVLLSDGTIHDLETEASTDLTGGKGGFEGLSGQSDDLSHLYFVDDQVLDATPNEYGEEAKAGQPNLYSWQGGATTYVTTLLAKDNARPLGVWTAPPVRRSAETSPDGRWLAFGSQAELTGTDSVGACKYDPDKLKYVGAVPCEEVFLYDSQTGKLSCPSCNPVGAAPLGGSFLRLELNAQGHLPQPRYLTDSGRLYFDSRDALTATDTNGQVEDVYQYEPNGVGNCEKQGGCVSLITSGRGEYDSNFLAMSVSGRDVFFTTRERLLARDIDSLIDVYDAREGGGFPEDAASAPVPCQGENCLPAARVPAMPNLGSGALSSSGGNLKPPNPNPRCPKGKRRVQRKGSARCVRPKAKHRRHQRPEGRKQGGAR